MSGRSADTYCTKTELAQQLSLAGGGRSHSFVVDDDDIERCRNCHARRTAGEMAIAVEALRRCLSAMRLARSTPLQASDAMRDGETVARDALRRLGLEVDE